MGLNEDLWRVLDPSFGKPFTTLQVTPEREGEDRAGAQLHREKLAAQAEAERYLAEAHLPEDLRSWARSYRIEALSEVVWTNGFLRGWRMGLARQNPTVQQAAQALADAAGREIYHDGVRYSPKVAKAQAVDF